MVNADQERLSENPNQGHRAPRDRTVTSLKWGQYVQAGGAPVNAILGSRLLPHVLKNRLDVADAVRNA